MTVTHFNKGSVNKNTVWAIFYFGSFAALEYMAYTYVAFTCLESGVSVYFHTNERSKKWAVWTVLLFKWFWLAVQLGGQAMAQYNQATYLTLYYLTIPKGDWMLYYDRQEWWQSVNAYTVLLANVVLIAALILIKRQEVIKRPLRVLMMLCFSVVLLTETSAGILGNILDHQSEDSEMSEMRFLGLCMDLNLMKFCV